MSNRLWVWLITHPLIVAAHCTRRGHDWREERPTRCVTLTVCAWCGQLRGSRVKRPSDCNWYQRSAA